MAEKKHGPQHVFDTAEDLKAAIDDYIANPAMRKVYYKHDVYEVPSMTMEAIAIGIGFKTRQSMYDQKKRGDDFAEVIQYVDDQLIIYWSGVGEHGNHAHAKLMLANLGVTEKQPEESPNKGVTITITEAVKPSVDRDTADETTE